jgi:hypothetical protein
MIGPPIVLAGTIRWKIFTMPTRVSRMISPVRRRLSAAASSGP